MLVLFSVFIATINIVNCCTTNDDCSLLGQCNLARNECECNNGFYGLHCNYINLTASIPWNIDGYHNYTQSSWDGWPIKENNKYHLFISVITNNCTLKGYWTTNSIIAHVISNNAIGPYTLSDIALYPDYKNKSSFDSLSVYNPAVIKVNNSYLLYYTATSGKKSANCTSYNVAGTTSTQKIGVAISNSLYGPWNRSVSNPIITPNPTNKYLWNSQFVTNPAPLLLNNYSIAVVYKAKPLDQGNNSHHTMYHGIAITKSNVNGPYKTINKEPFNVPTYCADPFLWSTSNDSAFHILFQCHWNCSQQITFSNDLLNWKYFDEQKWCNVSLSNQTNIELLRRERPALIFNNNKEIEYLYSAVQPQTERTFNSVQKV